MGAELERVGRTEPCAICGHVDWCCRLKYDDGSTVHICYRKEGLSGCDVTGIDGRRYRYKGTKQGDLGVYGTFQEYQEYEDYRRKWMEAKGYNYSDPSGYRPKEILQPQKETVYEGILEPASPDKLDSVYRYFLSLLTVEEWHLRILSDEWGQGVEPDLCKKVFSLYPIRSIPPEDKVRFKLTHQKFKNQTRKKIMQLMIQKFGSLEGVPGFYQRSYDKAWTFTSLSGICYPIYNTYGQIIRLRVADDYPMVVSEDEKWEYHFSNKVAAWYRQPYKSKTLTELDIVESQSENIHLIEMSAKGYPKGKVEGKYKNFSSYKEIKKDMGNKIAKSNFYLNGTRSGSYCSIYYPQGCDFHTVYVTEGEKKGIVPSILLNVPVATLPGVGCFRKLLNKQDGYDESIIEFLIRKGCKNLVICYDADKTVNVQVLASEKGAAATLIETGLYIYIGEWNPHFGKGFDDISIRGSRPVYHPIVF